MGFTAYLDQNTIMEIPTQLRCLFAGAVEQQDGTYLIEIPEREIDRGELQQGETYRVAVLGAAATDGAAETPTDSQRERTPSMPPVGEGEQRTVEIEDMGIRATASRVLSVASSLLSLIPSAASVLPSKSPT